MGEPSNVDDVEDLRLQIAELTLELCQKKKEIREITESIQVKSESIVSKDSIEGNLDDIIGDRSSFPSFINSTILRTIASVIHDFLKNIAERGTVAAFGHNISVTIKPK